MDVLFRGELVELGGESLSQSAGVAEHDRRAVGEDLLEDAQIDGQMLVRRGTTETVAGPP